MLGDQEIWLKYPIVLLAGLITAWILTPPVRRLASTLGLVDRPDERRVHRTPTPRCGLSVFLGFHVACAAVFLIPWRFFASDLTPLWWWRFLILSSVLMLVGLADDRWGLPAWSKLLAQILVAVLAHVFDMRMSHFLGFGLPPGVDLVVTVLWFVTVINAFNLIDGIDGLAAGLAVVASLGVAGSFLLRHLPGNALVLVGLAGSCLGFLRYNFHPASIFLGDSGSMFLGATIAAATVSTGAKSTAVATLVVPLLAVGVPLLDTGLAVWRRTARRVGAAQSSDSAPARVFGADLDHLHHRLLRDGRSQRSVAAWLYAWGLFLAGVGLLSMMYRSHAVGIYLLAFLMAAHVAARRLAPIELWESGRAILASVGRPRGRQIALAALLGADVLALVGALALATALSTPLSAPLGLRRFWIDRLPLWVGLPFLAVSLARCYDRIWARARLADYALLGGAVLTGAVAAAGLDNLLHLLAPRDLVLHVALFMGVAFPVMAVTRALPQMAADFLMTRPYAHRALPSPPCPMLVYGTGPTCQAFLLETATAEPGGRDRCRVVGLIAAHPALRGCYVFGYRVLGTLEDADLLISRHRAEVVLLTEPLDAAALGRLQQAARRHGARVMERRTELREVS